MGIPQMAYISGSLIDLHPSETDQTKHFYEQIGEVCREAGFEPYIPHQHTDPIKAASLSPKDVDDIDRKALTSSAVVICVAFPPSIGVGIEIEMANHAHKPVILMRPASIKISRLARGSPSVVREIAYHDRANALPELKKALHDLMEMSRSLPELLRLPQPSVETT